MPLIELHQEDYITIYLNKEEDWLYVDWTGYQTEETVKAGCTRLLELMAEHEVFSILNDNTRVLGTWIGAAQWGATEWFPAMHRAGLRSFAWVYSPSLASQDATDASLKGLSRDELGVYVCYNIRHAQEWLRYRHENS